MQIKAVLKSEPASASMPQASGNGINAAGRDERWLQQVKQEYGGNIMSGGNMKVEEGAGPRMTEPQGAAGPLADAPKEMLGQAQPFPTAAPAAANGSSTGVLPAPRPSQPAQPGANPTPCIHQL